MSDELMGMILQNTSATQADVAGVAESVKNIDNDMSEVKTLLHTAAKGRLMRSWGAIYDRDKKLGWAVLLIVLIFILQVTAALTTEFTGAEINTDVLDAAGEILTDELEENE